MDLPLIEKLVLLVVVGAIVAIAARRLKIPYTVGLVMSGVVMTLLPFKTDIQLDRTLVFELLLPPLIFEAALYIEWSELKRDLLVLGTYATVGVTASAALTAAIMHFAVGWTWPAAIIFGVLIAATDPVSIIATFKVSSVFDAESCLMSPRATVSISENSLFGMLGRPPSAGN